jgi:Spy/CpxP family protein refolding chaperone
MKITTFLKCAFLAASLLWATVFQASAQAPAGGGGGGGRGNFGILTQEQRTKLNETIQADLTPLTEKLRAAEKDLAKAGLAGDISEADFRAKIAAVHKIQADVMVVRLKGVKAIASTLTPEQKTQLDTARDGGYMALFGGMGGGMGGGRNGGARRNAGGGNN